MAAKTVFLFLIPEVCCSASNVICADDVVVIQKLSTDDNSSDGNVGKLVDLLRNDTNVINDNFDKFFRPKV